MLACPVQVFKVGRVYIMLSEPSGQVSGDEDLMVHLQSELMCEQVYVLST